MKIGKYEKSLPLPPKLVVKHETAHHWQTLNPFLNYRVKQTFLSLFLLTSNRNIFSIFVWNRSRIRSFKDCHLMRSRMTWAMSPGPANAGKTCGGWAFTTLPGSLPLGFSSTGSQSADRRSSTTWHWQECCRRFAGIFFPPLMEIVHAAQKKDKILNGITFESYL